MLRCPTCLALLVEADPVRCPMCNKRLRRRRGRSGAPREASTTSAQPPSQIDLAHIERTEAEAEAPKTEPAPLAQVAAAPLVAEAATAVVESPPVAEAPRVGEAPRVDEAPPVVEAPTATTAPDHTSIFEPSQLDPEMRELLDGLYRKARAELGEEERS